MASANVEVAKAAHHPGPVTDIPKDHMETLKSCLNRCDRIPVRKGTRPNTICGPLHIQSSGGGCAKYFPKLINEVLAWPRVECTPPIVRSSDLISIHLKQAEGAIGSSAITSVKQFANVYLDGPTIHLALPLVAAHWAILRGWAEPHYLASTGSAASRHRTVIYANGRK